MHQISAGPRKGTSYERLLNKANRIQQKAGSDVRLRPRWEKKETPYYIEGAYYTRKELECMADEILIESALPGQLVNEFGILMKDAMRARLRREIYVGIGVPDPSVVCGMYWRTHPQGRKVIENDPEERAKKGAAFYR